MISLRTSCTSTIRVPFYLIQMEKCPFSKSTKHIHVCFLYIKDFIEHGDMSVEYFPTGEMWSYVLTKPFQVIAFKKMRDMLMNCSVEYLETVFEDIDTIAGLHKPDFYPFPSRSENHVTLGNASQQECVGGVPKQ